MNEFIFLYRNSDKAYQEAMGSPERAQKSMQKWMAWMKGLEEKGRLKNFGQPLQRVGKVVGKAGTITDGPYAETKDVVGGYSVVLAGDLDEAARLAEGCPVLDGGGSVEVRPVRAMP